MIQRALIAGGKTGGHLYPGIAVAEEILARNPSASVTFVGTQDGIESRVLPKLGYTLETITISRLKGGGLMSRLAGLLRVPVAMAQTCRLLRQYRPEVVLGVGGYASGPALLMAWICRYPTAIQEQNAHAGLTNRILGRIVRRIYLGFEAASRQFSGRNTLATGNPIRRALVHALLNSTDDEERTAVKEGLRILVFGGSQGARFLNEQVPGVLSGLRDARPKMALRVTHQTGRHDLESTRSRYDATSLGTDVTVLTYIDDMPTAYAEADVAICRAGALTIAELTAVGLPCLLVPFPFAADNHQEANAKVLVDAGAARMMTQAEWEPAAAITWLGELADNRSQLRVMSKAAQSAAQPMAASAVVDDLEAMLYPNVTQRAQ
jgi:UDP-N-acetylglucosamine--N-acetylmuramyl-(pentapeptide) pyrophosphoryl-undecaprenol N-acetylglucosamine transferase